MSRVSPYIKYLCVLAFVALQLTLSAQAGWNETGKRIANNIKTITTETCYQQFGKADSCVVTDIQTYDRKGRALLHVAMNG